MNHLAIISYTRGNKHASPLDCLNKDFLEGTAFGG